jgi:hypothetical protein
MTSMAMPLVPLAAAGAAVGAEVLGVGVVASLMGERIRSDRKKTTAGAKGAPAEWVELSGFTIAAAGSG